MTENPETLAGPPVEQNVRIDGTGLLDIIHQRWLERTEGGDSQFIASRLNQQTESGESDEESYAALLEGYIARIGKEHVTATRSEADIYQTGRYALRTYFESAGPKKSKKIKLWDILGVIEEAYEIDEQAEASQSNGHAPEVPADPSRKLAPGPRIQRVRRKYTKNPEPASWTKNQSLKALDIANQLRLEQAEIRTGLRQGKISLGEALASPSAERLAVADLLGRLPGLGEARMRKALRAVGTAETSEVGALDSEQRDRLIAMFPAEKHQPDERRKATANHEQAMTALKCANEARIYRAAMKNKLAAGEMTVEELLDDPIADGMKLGEILLKLPTRKGANPKSIRSLKLRDVVLYETGLPGSKRLNQLTKRQQGMLIGCLAARRKEENGLYTSVKTPASVGISS